MVSLSASNKDNFSLLRINLGRPPARADGAGSPELHCGCLSTLCGMFQAARKSRLSGKQPSPFAGWSLVSKITYFRRVLLWSRHFSHFSFLTFLQWIIQCKPGNTRSPDTIRHVFVFIFYYLFSVLSYLSHSIYIYIYMPFILFYLILFLLGPGDEANAKGGPSKREPSQNFRESLCYMCTLVAIIGRFY